MKLKKMFLIFAVMAALLVPSVDVRAVNYNVDTDVCVLSDGVSSKDEYFYTSRWDPWPNSTYAWRCEKSQLGRYCFYYYGSSPDDGASIKLMPYSYFNGRGYCEYLYYVSSPDKSAQYTNAPVFKTEDAAVSFMNDGVLSLDDLDLRFCPPGFTFNSSGGLAKKPSEGYEESIGYPLNLEFHNYSWGFGKDRWCTWSTGEYDVDEYLRCEIYYNCQISQFYELLSEPVCFTVPKRALHFSDNSASSCLSDSKTMTDMCVNEIYPYLRENNNTEHDFDGSLPTTILRRRAMHNLEVWARFYYVDDSDFKHYGNWVKWTKDGVEVLKDKSQLEESEEEDAPDTSKNTSTSGYVKSDDGVDPDKTSDEENVDGVPTKMENDNSGNDLGNNSGSSSGSSADDGFSIMDILKGLGGALTGLAKLLLGAIEAFVKFLGTLLSGIVDIVKSLSSVSEMFSILVGWLPVSMEVVLGIAVAVAIIMRVMSR